ncbi:E3 ubiquitin-protein ligase rififylin-like [Anguilla rostrata]|uniref:E3 ubiquitin-protein ligase rififylin-like n=1 Tax=Anguilla rostrata TaxID=7938 RepID=UPI0030D19EEF
MWASCCSWLCVDLGGGEDSSGQRQAYSNSGFRSSPSPPAPELACKACGGRFNSLARKHVCVDCRKNFCGRCSAELELHPRLCHTCQRFHGTLFQRAELMKLKVKDLRDYLHLHEVPTHTCREKEELVELVLNQHTPGEEVPRPATPTDPPQTTPQPPPPPAEPTSPPPTLDEDQGPAVQEDTPDTETDPQGPEEQETESQSSDVEETAPPGRRASLSDLSCVEDIDGLSVRQLKELLARNFVDYKGCCEKWELMERVTRLYNDQRDLQELLSDAVTGTDSSAPSGLEENLCKICMDRLLLAAGVLMVTCPSAEAHGVSPSAGRNVVRRLTS